MTNLKSKARQKFLPLTQPSTTASHAPTERQAWIDSFVDGFVSPSSVNKRYYRLVVETLWPEGHGIPGPYVSENEIRDAINLFRQENRIGRDPDRPYLDVFRRVRELQGEEGLTGVARQGNKYQLVSLEVGKKRVPRTKLADEEWDQVKALYNYTCPACRRREPQVRFQQDHKVPRTRGGGDGVGNWQPLCDECNNFKSVACRGCELDCQQCCWAYPEKYAPIRLSSEILEGLHRFCRERGLEPDRFVEVIIKHELSAEC